MQLRGAVMALAAMGGLGCQSMIMESTGSMMSAYTTQHLAPYNLATTDPGMACEIAQSTGNLLLSYKRVDADVHKAAVSTMASAGACAETAAWAHELRGIRALKSGNAAEAQDARIAEMREHAVAAQRYFSAYTHMVKLLGEPKDSCPDFEDLDDGDNEENAHATEVAFLLGHISGVQAVQHDRAAKEAVGVPMDVPRKVARSIHCLNNVSWWGVPEALQAAIWTGVPGATPEGKDPWKQLDASSAVASKAGIRLAIAIHAQAAAAAGKEDRVRAQIKAFVAAGETVAPKKWQLLDRQAQMNIQVLSDRLWTAATGHRTPYGELGSFWDETEDEPEDDSLLEGLDDEAPAAESAAPSSAS